MIKKIISTLADIASNKNAAKKLPAAGVLVRTIASPYMHAKLILADNVKAYIGSVNFSTQSLDQNRELGIILTQSQSIQTLASIFESDWSRAEAVDRTF